MFTVAMRYSFEIPKFIEWFIASQCPVRIAAARASYSRSHFSRTFSAKFGESARSFRRRLQLEAGAYLLRRSKFSIGEVAIEVGFETPEGFTKAFRSTFGLAPRDFRLQAGRSYWVSAPSGVHFHPNGLIVRRQGETSMKLSEILIRHHVDETSAILRHLETLDDADLDRATVAATEGVPWETYEPSLRGLSRCLVATEAIWVAAFDGTEFPAIESKPTVSELIATHDSVGKRLIQLLNDVESQDLWESEFVDALCDDHVRFEYGAVVAHIIVFSAHRRQLALAALRSLGVVGLDYGDPINWLRVVRGGSAFAPSC